MTRVFLNVRGVGLLTLCAASLLFSACTTTIPKSEMIEQRAAARWDALLGDDIEVAYSYLSPGYRSSVSYKQYYRSLLLTQVQWKGAEYTGSVCEETSCNVKILMDFTIYGAVPGVKSFESKQEVEESWVLVDGSWYFVPKN
jgi:hypothetical protein